MCTGSVVHYYRHISCTNRGLNQGADLVPCLNPSSLTVCSTWNVQQSRLPRFKGADQCAALTTESPYYNIRMIEYKQRPVGENFVCWKMGVSFLTKQSNFLAFSYRPNTLISLQIPNQLNFWLNLISLLQELRLHLDCLIDKALVLLVSTTKTKEPPRLSLTQLNQLNN